VQIDPNEHANHTRGSGDSVGSIEWVSARDLSRRTAELLDQVASGTVIKICRHGRPVAVLSALPEAPLRHARTSPKSEPDDLSLLTAEEQEQLSELDRMQREVLKAMGDGGAPDQIVRRLRGQDPSDIAVALGRLEIARLIVKGYGGYVLTIRGARLQKFLIQQSEKAERDSVTPPMQID
jgi:antitoxin (DNA-binding transcriptional repressor) of toxin-antitoxin stability system